MKPYEEVLAERDALAAQAAAYKERSSELYKLCDELIDHLRYNKAERDDVLREFWAKQEAIKHVPSDPKQCLANVKVDVVIEFAEWAFDNCPNIDCMFDDKDGYIALPRQGGK